MRAPELKRKDLVFPELSYQIVGALFDVYTALGYGHNEKVYQKAVAAALAKSGLKFQEQVYVPVMFETVKIGTNYLDFLVESKVIVELKRGDKYLKNHIEQLYSYLVAKKLQLGILAYFGPRKLLFKRIVNIRS